MIGAGPAGCAAAVSFARVGRTVELIARPPASRRFAIGEGAPPGLDRTVDDVFGPGTFLAAHHLRCLGNRAAWGTADVVTTDHMFNPFGTGWHLDRSAFDARLLAATAAAGVAVSPTIRGEEVEGAGLVVDATGRRALHARQRDARRVVVDRLVAVVTIYERAASDADATTTVEAVESGWWYTCPVPSGRRVVAHLTDGDLLEHRLRSAPAFDRSARATTHIAALLPAGGPCEPVVTAAETAHLDPPAGDRWMAVGDAAASFDPLSSQGILTAIVMGREAALHAGDPDEYAERYRSVRERYDAERRSIHDMEQRWPRSPFWARRRLTTREAGVLVSAHGDR